MTDRPFVASALFQFAQAWVGAIQTSGASLSATLRFEDVRDFMGDGGLALFPREFSSQMLARSLGLPEPRAPSPASHAPRRVEFPQKDVEAALKSIGARVRRVPGGFDWEPSQASQGSFRIDPLGSRTDDGHLVTDRVAWTVRAGWMNDVDDVRLDAWNRFASFTGFVRDPLSRQVALVSKLSVFGGDQVAVRQVYGPLMAQGATALAWILEQVARRDPEARPADSPFAGVDLPPPVSSQDLANVLKHQISPLGLVGSVGKASLTAEVPWAVGAMTRMAGLPRLRARLRRALGLEDSRLRTLGGKTALIVLRTDMRHPWFGRGIQATLEIPTSRTDPSIFELVRDLNAWEVETDDLPPYFGAWVVGPRAPMFQSFFPNELCVPGLINNVASWSVARAGLVRQWLGADGDAGSWGPSASA